MHRASFRNVTSRRSGRPADRDNDGHLVHRPLPGWLPPTLLVPVVFAGVFANGWVNWDDPLHVLDNPKLQVVSTQSLAWFWQHPYRGLFIPVSYCFFAAETVAGRFVSGGQVPAALVFHAVSVVLHALNVAAVARIIMLCEGGRWPAAVGAALFAIHPLQVESVAWASEQRGLLAACGSLTALLLVLTPCNDKDWMRRAVLASVVYAVALLSKPSAVVTPCLGIAIAAATNPTSRLPPRRLLALFAAWGIMAAGATLTTAGLQPTPDGLAATPGQRALLAVNALAWYAEKALLPRGLCIDYGLPPAVMLAGPIAALRFIGLTAVVLAVLMMRRLSPLRLPLMLFIISLTPVLGFIPFVFETISVVADRYAYLALIGPAIAAAFVFRLFCTFERHAAMLMTGLLLAWLATGTIHQVGVWHDSLSLNTHAMAINGGTSPTLNNLGLALLEVGRFDAAADYFRAAIARDPDFPPAHYNLALAQHRGGRRAEAERCYREALRLEPGYASAFNGLGILLAETGRLDEAESAFESALEITPTSTEASDNLRRVRAIRAAPE